MARHGQTFDQFRDILIERDIPEKRGTENEEMLELKDGTRMTVGEALQRLPEAELSSPGGFSFTRDLWTSCVFLDIYDDKSDRYSRHFLTRRYLLDILDKNRAEERAEEERHEREISERYPNRRLFLCYFRQDSPSPYDGGGGAPIRVNFVHSETFAPDQRDAAKKRADELERARYEKGDFNLQIVPRLAATSEDALKEVFLDS